MKRHCFVCLFHSSDCSEEVECVVEQYEDRDECPHCRPYRYRLVSYPSTCKCGRYVPHSDPPQEVLRAAWGLSEAEDVT